MTWLQAVVLGIVQGLTEFLPISSSGHVFLAPLLFPGMEDPGAGFTAVIQIGTIIAVLLYFWRDLLDMIKGWAASLKPGNPQTPQSKLGWAVILGTIPIAVVGLVLEDQIDTVFRGTYVVAGSLILFGIVLAIAEKVGKRERDIKTVTLKDGLQIGLWQCIALIPGSSRSGCTITGGLFLGMERDTAARFSFLLSVPAILASGLYKLVKEKDVLLADGMTTTIIATIAAFISGYAAIAFLMKFLQTRSTMVFVIYRVALGILLIGLVLAGVIPSDF